jgi:tripartite-type tricarboxylate transporter receptor subunit TctC
VTVLFRVLLCCAIVALAGDGSAQTWPSRPIKLIVPTGPGAATDVMARLLADGVSRTLGQAMVVENMPGASGLLAHQSVARAQPDGYTLLFTNTSGMAINLISFKQLPYDPTRDFTPVALVCSLGPQMLSVNEQVPVATVGELIAYGKSNAGKLSIAFDNTAGAAAFAAKLFNKRSGLDLVEVPYRSAAQMTQDVGVGGAAQPRNRALPQGSRDPGPVAGARARDRGRRNARKHRADHPAGAGAVARAREGVGGRAAVRGAAGVSALRGYRT